MKNITFFLSAAFFAHSFTLLAMDPPRNFDVPLGDYCYDDDEELYALGILERPSAPAMPVIYTQEAPKERVLSRLNNYLLMRDFDGIIYHSESFKKIVNKRAPEDGLIPLIYAIKELSNTNSDAVKAIVEDLDADVNISEDGHSALYFAFIETSSTHMEIVDYLIGRGAQFNDQDWAALAIKAGAPLALARKKMDLRNDLIEALDIKEQLRTIDYLTEKVSPADELTKNIKTTLLAARDYQPTPKILKKNAAYPTQNYHTRFEIPGTELILIRSKNDPTTDLIGRWGGISSRDELIIPQILGLAGQLGIDVSYTKKHNSDVSRSLIVYLKLSATNFRQPIAIEGSNLVLQSFLGSGGKYGGKHDVISIYCWDKSGADLTKELDPITREYIGGLVHHAAHENLNFIRVKDAKQAEQKIDSYIEENVTNLLQQLAINPAPARIGQSDMLLKRQGSDFLCAYDKSKIMSRAEMHLLKVLATEIKRNGENFILCDIITGEQTTLIPEGSQTLTNNIISSYTAEAIQAPHVTHDEFVDEKIDELLLLLTELIDSNGTIIPLPNSDILLWQMKSDKNTVKYIRKSAQKNTVEKDNDRIKALLQQAETMNMKLNLVEVVDINEYLSVLLKDQFQDGDSLTDYLSSMIFSLSSGELSEVNITDSIQLVAQGDVIKIIHPNNDYSALQTKIAVALKSFSADMGVEMVDTLL